MYHLNSIQQRIDDFKLTIDNFEFKQGMIYAVTGPNGSGKSTLLDILSLISQPSAGSVTFENQKVNYNNTTGLLEKRRRIGYLMQNPYLFNMNVFNNINYSLKVRSILADTARNRVNDILAKMNLTHLSNRSAHTLSKGEAQRTALARTLVIDAPVYLLDEPTANVDKANVDTVEAMIMSLKEEKHVAVIFSTHSTSQAERLADVTINLNNGKIV